MDQFVFTCTVVQWSRDQNRIHNANSVAWVFPPLDVASNKSLEQLRGDCKTLLTGLNLSDAYLKNLGKHSVRVGLINQGFTPVYVPPLAYGRVLSLQERVKMKVDAIELACSYPDLPDLNHLCF